MRQILTIALLLMAMTSSAGDGVADDRWVGTWARRRRSHEEWTCLRTTT